MRRVRLSALALALICAIPAPAIAAAAVSSVTLSVESATPGAPVTISGLFSQPTQWRVDVVAACGGGPRRTLTGFSTGGTWQVQWDGLDDANLPLVPGSYRIRVSPTVAVDCVGSHLSFMSTCKTMVSPASTRRAT